MVGELVVHYCLISLDKDLEPLLVESTCANTRTYTLKDIQDNTNTNVTNGQPGTFLLPGDSVQIRSRVHDLWL